MIKNDTKITTKSLPSNNLSSPNQNVKYTRVVWWTHNDFHNHEFWEICLVLRGKGKNHFLTHSEDMYAGTMWLLRPQDVHMIEPTSSSKSYAHRDVYIEDDTMKRILNAFKEGFYEELMQAEKPLSSLLPLPDVLHIENLINKYSLNEASFEFMHAVITSHIIACALEQNHQTEKTDAPTWLATLLDKLNNLDFLILPMREIISSIDYSQEYICREFKKHTGTTLTKYIRKMKCMHSLTLLEDTNIPVVQIASMLYFPDESNYITTFRKIYNITPGEWRKRVKSK